MKQPSIVLLVIMTIVFAFEYGCTKTSSVSPANVSHAHVSSGNVNAINDFYFNFNQKTRDRLHKLADDCINDVAQIPTDEKIKYCEQQNKQSINFNNIAHQNNVNLWKQNLAACKDAVCQQNNQNMLNQENTNFNQMAADLYNCQANSDGPLIRQCKSIENAVLMLD